MAWSIMHRVMVAGHAEVHRVGGAVRFSSCFAEAPLVLRPLARRDPALLYVGQLGGGYVAGDEYELSLAVRAGASLTVLGQASAKVYPGERGVRVRVRGHVEAGGCLALLGEPLVPYAESSYEGRIRIALDAGASTLVWESFTAGRLARGERWQLAALRNAVECERDGRVVARDAIRLTAADASEGCGPMNAFATLLIGGPRFEPWLDELARRVRRSSLASVDRRGDLLLARFGVTEPGQLAQLRADTAEWLLAHAGHQAGQDLLRAAGSR